MNPVNSNKEQLRNRKQRDIIPQIVEEVMSKSAPAPSDGAPATANPTQDNPILNATKRESDYKNMDQNISEYFGSMIALRDRYANRLYMLLLFEVLAMFGIVIAAGLGVLQLEQWLVLIIAESIIAKTFLTIQIIVKNLFPTKNLLELFVRDQ